MRPSMKNATASVQRIGLALKRPTTRPFIAPISIPAATPHTSAGNNPRGSDATVMIPENAIIAGMDRSAMLPE